jgi:hypothetical protein
MRLSLSSIFFAVHAFMYAGEPGIHASRTAAHPLREWAPWTQMNLPVSYVSLSYHENSFLVWFNASFQGRDSLIRLQGPDLSTLERIPPQFDTEIVQAYDRDLDGLNFPILSRSSGVRLRDGTEMVQGSVGPRYRGGGSELFPALFFKPPGGPWQHTGPPPGEPADLLNAIRQKSSDVRSEGGGIIELPDGRLRMYLHGLPENDAFQNRITGGRLIAHTLLVAESDGPGAPWTFLRTREGTRLNLFTSSPLPWLFVHVQPLGDQGYLLTGADAWPPQKIYAAYSRDGLHFRNPTDPETGHAVPLIHAVDVSPDARFCKVLRGVLMPDGKTFTAIMNISRPQDRGMSTLFFSRASFNLNTFKTLFENEYENPHF